MEKSKIFKNLDRLSLPKILVIGDFAIDEMVFGQTERISREAPVLILQHSETKIILGTASNAANNISSINGGKVGAIGVYGDDYYGGVLIKTLNDAKINTDFMVMDKTRKTTTKTRISGSCSQSITQQIVRIDRQTKAPLSDETEKKVIENIKKAIPLYDGVILSDYHLGCLTGNVIKAAIETAKTNGKIIVADIQKDMEKYRGVTAITPNQPDSEKFLGYFIQDEESLKKAGEDLTKRLDLKYTLITRGEKGMVLFENATQNTGSVSNINSKDLKYADAAKQNSAENSHTKPVMTTIPAFNKKEVFDVTGAGDTVVAAFTLALCAGLSPKEAMVVGNLAASIVIRQFGCHTTNLEELKAELNNIKEI